MNRDIILVMGMTGYGKSLWAKLYHRMLRRSITYDPTMTFPVKEYLPGSEIYSRLANETPPKQFDYGFVEEDDLEGIGSLTFVVGHMMLIIEECATVFEKGLRMTPPWAKQLCFFGRHRACSLMLIAQRPTYIPIDFRSQANRVITFCQHEGSDMNWLGDFYSKEYMQKLPTLPKLTCLDYHNGEVSQYSIRSQVERKLGISLDI